ncbi:MAG: hypothetical protein RJQ01_02610 [Microcella sp.]|uniref:hypothetical protein n=1 Tax=Microcella sp. TaxID=1913979 RepID=UPI0033162D55
MTSSSARAPRARGTAHGWLSVGAASALGLGLVAASAASLAGAMPLVDSTTEAAVPPISSVSLEEVKGVGSAGASVPAPAAATAPDAPTPSPRSAPAVAPAPAPQPVAPAPPASPASVDTPPSVESPASAGSDD